MFKKLTVRCVKTLWALFASTVVLLAVVISLLKFALPYADDYKTNIESYLLERFGANIKIGSIGASWQTSGPVIVLNQVALTPSREAPLDISIRETRVELDFWQSIAQQRVVTGAFLLEGIRSRINSSAFFKVRPRSEGNQLFESLSHLFLSQVQQFKVLDSFIIVDHEDGQSQDFQIDNLTWVNQGNRHQGQGEVFVDGFSNNSLAVIVDLYGQRRDDIFGQIYLEANKIDVTPWLTQVVGEHIDFSETEANFAVWGDVQGGLVENILLDIRNSGIRWKKDNQIKYLKVESANVQWWKSNDDWLLFGNQVRLHTDRNIPDPFGFSLFQGQEETVLSLRQVDVTAASQLLSLFSATKQMAVLAGSDLSGNIDELLLSWGDELDVAGKIILNDFTFRPEYEADKAYLGLEDARLSAYLLGHKVYFEATGIDGQLITHDTFSKPIGYSQLNMAGLVDWGDEQIHVSLPQIQLLNDEVNLNLAAQYIWAEESYLDLYAEVVGPTIGNVNKYLPRHLLSTNVYNYLNGAIEQGRGEITQVVLSGDPSQMPFSKLRGSDQAGRFLVNAEIRDALFRFDSRWPALEQLNANLTVDNSLMTISANEGQLGHLILNNDVVASIPLDAAQTNLHLEISPESLALEDFHRLVNNSPLEQIIGGVFEFVQLKGGSKANVNIDIPLSEGADQDVVVEGRVVTESADLALPAIFLEFEDVQSEVTFRNDVFAVNAQSAHLFELPVSLSVKGRRGDNGYEIDGDLFGTWSQTQVKQHYPQPIVDYFQGEGTSSVKVRVNIEDEGYQYFVGGKTDLTQGQYRLSGPLKNDIGEYASLDWSLIGDQEGQELFARLDDKLFFTGNIPNSTARMEQAHLSIGQDEAALPEQGFDISVNIEQLEFEPVLGFVLDLIDSLPSSGSTGPGFVDVPHAIKANVQQLDILGLQWHNVSLDAKPMADHWLFSVGAQESLTSVKVFDDIKTQGIQIESEFMHIVTENGEGESDVETSADTNAPEVNTDKIKLTGSNKLIASLPPINGVCLVCTFNGKPLGQVNLKTRTEGDKLWIETASFSYKRNHFEGEGWWQGDEKSGHTELSGQLTSRYFGDWLKEWGLDSGIKDSNATIDLALKWPEAPHEFAFEQLNGTAKIKLGEGYLSEVSDQGARIFSLFSLDSLYRKLKFDFSDVFEKGLFYNDIKGDLLVRNGVAHSDNIEMDGVAGDMTMKGHTDLNTNTLDYNVSFKPKITSSLPALVWISGAASGGLGVLAALAVDKIIESAEVVSEIKMKITGDLSKPDVEEVERFTRTVKLPNTKKPQTDKPKSSNPEAKAPIEGDGL